MRPSAQRYWVIDFDSTIIQTEALDELAAIVMRHHKDAATVQDAIRQLTEQAMNGELDFGTALQKRLALLPVEQKHLDELIQVLLTRITPSFLKHTEW